MNQEGEVRIYTSTQKPYQPTERRKRKLWDPTLLRESIGEKYDHPTSFVLKNGRHENTAYRQSVTNRKKVRSASSKKGSVGRMPLDAWKNVPKRTNRRHFPEKGKKKL